MYYPNLLRSYAVIPLIIEVIRHFLQDQGNRGPIRRMGSPSKARTKWAIYGWKLANNVSMKPGFPGPVDYRLKIVSGGDKLPNKMVFVVA